MPAGHPPVSGIEGIEAPDFTLKSIDGKKVSLSDYEDHVVVLNFWSSSCGPCILEMPSFEKLQAAMAGKPFQILTVTSDPRQTAINAARELRLQLPVLLDEKGAAARSYGVAFTPETIIIAPDGTVNNKIMGAANWADPSAIDYMNSLIEQSGGDSEEKGPSSTE